MNVSSCYAFNSVHYRFYSTETAVPFLHNKLYILSHNAFNSKAHFQFMKLHKIPLKNIWCWHCIIFSITNCWNTVRIQLRVSEQIYCPFIVLYLRLFICPHLLTIFSCCQHNILKCVCIAVKYSKLSNIETELHVGFLFLSRNNCEGSVE